MAVANSPSKEISGWIRFFKSAQIPAGPAAKYAVVFVDNRIQAGMLPDLNKEYLNEMGITALGDVIAILKQAKIAYAKFERESRASPSYDEDISQAVPSRHAAHTAVKTQQQRSVPSKKEKAVAAPSETPAVPAVLAGRLGAAPKAKRVSSELQPDKGAALPVKRARRPMTEDSDDDDRVPTSGSHSKVVATKMPSNVFDRLGKGQGTTPAHPSPVTKVIVSSPPSVFKRLGAGGAVTSTSQDRDLSPSPSPPPQTKKVVVSLKSGSLVQKPVVSTTMTVKRLKATAPSPPVSAKLAKLGSDTVISIGGGAGAVRTVTDTSRQGRGSGVKPRKKDMSATSVLGRLGLPIEGGSAPVVESQPKFRVTLGTAEKAAATSTTPPVALLRSALFSDPAPAPPASVKNRLGTSSSGSTPLKRGLNATLGNSRLGSSTATGVTRRLGSASTLAKTSTATGVTRRLGSASSLAKTSTATGVTRRLGSSSALAKTSTATGVTRRLGSSSALAKTSTAARQLGSASPLAKSSRAASIAGRLGSAGSGSRAAAVSKAGGLVSDRPTSAGTLASGGRLSSRPAAPPAASGLRVRLGAKAPPSTRPTSSRPPSTRPTSSRPTSSSVFSRLGSQ